MGDREARARMFGALRVIYDGRLYRSIGGQPAGDGDELEWEGHLTLLAAATPAVDTHFSFEAALGERWLLFRLDEADDERARQRARYTVDREDVGPLREQAQKLAAALVHHARRRVPAHLSRSVEGHASSTSPSSPRTPAPASSSKAPAATGSRSATRRPKSRPGSPAR